MKVLFVFNWFMLMASCASAQKIAGVVSDSKTSESLPYVHIGVAGKNLGVISRDDGSYEIDLTSAGRDDVLVFSIIGYETRKLIAAEVQPGKLDVHLTPRVYQLKDVIVVRDTRERPTQKLGRYTPTKITTGQSGMKEFGFGGEWGLQISPEGKKYLINDVRLHMRYMSVDSVLFRVNMYAVEGGMPGESILQHEIFMTAYKKSKKKKWIVKDLVKENLVIDRNLIVTVEPVRIWFSKRGDNQLFFTHGEGYEQGRSYYRASSQDAWIDDHFLPATLYLTVEEF